MTIGGQPTTPPQTSPVYVRPPAPPQPPADARRITSYEDVQYHAKNSARLYIRAVVNSLGQVEKIRRNFFAGVSETRGVIALVMPNLTQSAPYAEGRATAQGRGIQPGQEEGLRAADREAASMAQADVARALDVAIQSQTRPDFQARVDFSNEIGRYAGATSPLAAPATLNQRLIDADKALQTQLRPYFAASGELLLTDEWFLENLRFSDLYATEIYDGNSALSRFRGANAFAGWLKNDPQGPSDLRDVYFYQRLIDSTVSQNADANDRTFTETFEWEYDRMIDAAWLGEVNQDEPRIRAIGGAFYQATYNAFASETGRYDQIREDYRQGSLDVFGGRLAALYVGAFNGDVNGAETSSFITDQAAHLVGSPGVNPQSATIGDSFDVSLDQATNRGFQAGDVTLSIRGLTQVTAASHRLEGLRRIAQPIQFKNFARLEDVTEADGNVGFDVYGTNGARVASGYVHASFEALINRLSRTDDPAMKTLIMGKISRWLSNEWDGHHSGISTSDYERRKGTLLLERLANVARDLGGPEKERLRAFSQDFKNTINKGQKPGFFGPGTDIKAALGILHDGGLL